MELPSRGRNRLTAALAPSLKISVNPDSDIGPDTAYRASVNFPRIYCPHPRTHSPHQIISCSAFGMGSMRRQSSGRIDEALARCTWPTHELAGKPPFLPNIGDARRQATGIPSRVGEAFPRRSRGSLRSAEGMKGNSADAILLLSEAGNCAERVARGLCGYRRAGLASCIRDPNKPRHWRRSPTPRPMPVLPARCSWDTRIIDIGP